jgi:hypothetical protein
MSSSAVRSVCSYTVPHCEVYVYSHLYMIQRFALSFRWCRPFEALLAEALKPRGYVHGEVEMMAMVMASIYASHEHRFDAFGSQTRYGHETQRWIGYSCAYQGFGILLRRPATAGTTAAQGSDMCIVGVNSAPASIAWQHDKYFSRGRRSSADRVFA